MSIKKFRRSKNRDWWEGGTLHESTLASWPGPDCTDSQRGNKIATIADYIGLMVQMPEIYPAIVFQNPNELLALYVVPMLAGIDNLTGEGYDDLKPIAIETIMFTMAAQLEFIKVNPVAEAVNEIKQEKLRSVLNETKS